MYHLQVITAATLGTAEFRTEKAIPLIGIENLNWHPQMRNTISLSKSVTKSGFCTSKINCHVMMQLTKTAYLPGWERLCVWENLLRFFLLSEDLKAVFCSGLFG